MNYNGAKGFHFMLVLCVTYMLAYSLSPNSCHFENKEQDKSQYLMFVSNFGELSLVGIFLKSCLIYVVERNTYSNNFSNGFRTPNYGKGKTQQMNFSRDDEKEKEFGFSNWCISFQP